MKIIFNGKLPEDRHPTLVCKVCDTTALCESPHEYGVETRQNWLGMLQRPVYTLNCPLCKKSQAAKLYY